MNVALVRVLYAHLLVEARRATSTNHASWS